MPKYLLTATVNCGVTYEVEADDKEQAEYIIRAALADHLNEGCNGVEVEDVDPLPNDADEVIGVRMPNHDEPHVLEFYERE